jgi:hypothetical protein
MGKKKKIQAIQQVEAGLWLANKEDLTRALRPLFLKITEKRNVRKEFAPIFPSEELLEEIREFERIGTRNPRLSFAYSVAVEQIERLLRKTFPGWKKASIAPPSINAAKKQLPELHKDALQMVFSMLEPLEIASCMMVCKDWSSAGKTPAIWKGKVLSVPTKDDDPINPLYLAPWTGIAMRYVDTVHVLNVKDSPLAASSVWIIKSPMFKQLITAFRKQQLPNVKKMLVGEDDYNGIVDAICTTPLEKLHLQDIVFLDGMWIGDIDAKLALLERSPSLHRAQLLNFNELYTGANSRWGTYNCNKVQEMFLAALSKNHHIQAVVVPALNKWPGLAIMSPELPDQFRGRSQFIEQLQKTIEAHPSLEEIEFQIWSNISIFQTTLHLLGLFSPLLGHRLKKIHIVQLPEGLHWRTHWWYGYGRGVEHPVPILETDRQSLLDIFSKLGREEDDEPAVILSYVKDHPDMVHMRELVKLACPEMQKSGVRIAVHSGVIS